MTKSWITFCVLEWHIEADLSDIPVMKEAWKKQFSNVLIEMQRRIEIHDKMGSSGIGTDD